MRERRTDCGENAPQYASTKWVWFDRDRRDPAGGDKRDRGAGGDIAVKAAAPKGATRSGAP